LLIQIAFAGSAQIGGFGGCLQSYMGFGRLLLQEIAAVKAFSWWQSALKAIALEIRSAHTKSAGPF
jgi:hypothetical protein